MLAELSDLEARLGETLSGTDSTRAEAALTDASALAKSLGDDTWTSSNAPDAVVAVVLASAQRAYQHPDGATQKSVGDASISWTGRSGSAVFFTNDEQRTIRRAAGRSVGTVTLESPYSGSRLPDLIL